MATPDDASQDLPIRVYDLVAQGSVTDGLDVADGRHIDLSVRDLRDLTTSLGVDGVRALCLYLEHLEHVPGHDGRATLGVPHFSARWLMETSARVDAARGGVPLGKSAATRGQQAVELSGLLRPLANPTAPGAGARGRTWRAVLGGRLVLVPNMADDEPKPLRGRPRLSAVPLHARSGKRQAAGPAEPLCDSAGNGDPGPSRFADRPETGTAEPVTPLVAAGFPDPEARGGSATSTSQSVVHQLLSSDTEPGLLRSRLVPVLAHDPPRAESRLYRIFNDTTVADRSEGLLRKLQLPTAGTERARVITSYLADVLLQRRSPVTDLVTLNVSGPPVLNTEQLAERLVVGVVVGLGMKQVASWGAWLHQVTRPSWRPKPNQTIDRFAAEILALPMLPTAGAGPEPPPSSAEQAEPPKVATRVRTEPQQVTPDVLADDVIAEYLPAARKRWPLFARDGTRQATDPVWQSRLVRMYLADLRRGTDLEAEETG